MTPDSNNIHRTLALTLQEMYNGVTKEITYVRRNRCEKCKDPKACSHCNREGIREETMTVQVDIPKGVAADMRIAKKGKGHLVQKKKSFLNILTSSKHVFGNLVLDIEQIPHEYFARNENDLFYHCEISNQEVIIADKVVEIQLLDESSIKIQIPKNTPDGKVLRIKGKGFESLIQNEERGDLYIKIYLKNS